MSKCKPCRSAEAKQRRQADPEAARERDRERYAREGSRYKPGDYQRYKERIDASAREWRAANPDRSREISRESARRIRQADPERAREQWRKDNASRAERRPPAPPRKRKYATDAERREAFNSRRRGQPRGEAERASHAKRQKEVRAADLAGIRARERERARQWRLANPEAARRKGQRDTSRRTARKRNADVRDVSERDLRRLLDRQRGCCFYCDQPEPTTLDHLIPLVRGGRHSIGNLVWACRTCNTSKGGRLVVEYRFGRSYRRRPAA